MPVGVGQLAENAAVLPQPGDVFRRLQLPLPSTLDIDDCGTQIKVYQYGEREGKKKDPAGSDREEYDPLFRERGFATSGNQRPDTFDALRRS